MIARKISVILVFFLGFLITFFLTFSIDVQNVSQPLPKKTWSLQEEEIYIHPFDIRSMSRDFYHLDEPVPLLPDNTPLDMHGIAVYKDAKTGKYYNHPVRLAHHTIHFITSYEMTNDSRYLDHARKYAQRLVDIAEVNGEAMYFPYQFDMDLHNIHGEHLEAPWYSGMAQGQALSAFVRLYKVTNEEKYQEWAHQVFASFKQLKSQNHWVAMVDNHYYWIEEYPMEQPTKVLNGFIFAIYGLYDYYQLTKDNQVKIYLQASLTTVHDHLTQYRRKDDAGLYCLKHAHQSPHYHLVHIEQLQSLYQMTGVSYFLEMSQIFHHDWYGFRAIIKRCVEWIAEKIGVSL